jgi:hypothetical protein
MHLHPQTPCFTTRRWHRFPFPYMGHAPTLYNTIPPALYSLANDKDAITFIVFKGTYNSHTRRMFFEGLLN